MTTHLSPDEQIAALDGALEALRADHLRACDTCSADIDRLRGTLAAVRDDVPEPSPLFWNHLSDRIRAATAAEPVPGPAPWWASPWGPAAGIGAVAAAMIVALQLAPAPLDPALPAPVVTDAASASSTSADDVSWMDMEQIAARLSADDVHVVVAAAPELGPTVGDLSAKERGAFVRLLGSELNGDLK